MARKKNPAEVGAAAMNAHAPSTAPRVTREATFELRHQLSEGLEWLNERAWPLGGYALFLAILCIHHYATQTGVSINPASSQLISMLAPMMAVVVYAVIMIMISVLMPTAVLFTPLRKGGPSLMPQVLRDKEGVLQDRGRRAGIALIWTLFVVTCAAMLLTAVWSFSEQHLPAWLELKWLVGTCLLVAVAMCGCLLSPGVHLRDICADFWLTAIAAAVVQFLISISIVHVAGRIASSSPDTGTYPYLWIYSLGIVVVVGVIQLIGAVVVAVVRSHERPVIVSFQVAVLALSIFCLFPPSANLLATYAIQSPLSGGRGCVVIEWSTHAGAEKNALSETAESAWSLPVRVLLESDDVLQVRGESGDGRVVFVPATSRVSMDDCPRK